MYLFPVPMTAVTLPGAVSISDIQQIGTITVQEVEGREAKMPTSSTENTEWLVMLLREKLGVPKFWILRPSLTGAQSIYNL